LQEEEFRDGIALCQSLPGATAMQMAAFTGLRVRGFRGAFASYVGFGLPAFLLMLLLSVLYAHYHDLSGVTPLFIGLQSSLSPSSYMRRSPSGKTP
jgi:chromate transporter